MKGRMPLPLIGAIATLLCATALTGLFEGFSWWFGPVLFGTLVAVGAGLLARAMRLPVWAAPLVYLLGLAWTVAIVSARDTLWAGLVPTGRTLDAITSLIDSGRTDVQGLAVPVPERPGLVLFTVAGVSAVAAAVDLLAAGLRRPSLAGLPLLGLFAVPAAVLPHGVGILPFVLGACGYIGLLFAEGRDLLGRWGRPLARSSEPRRDRPADPPMLGATGRRIGLAALAGAIVLPALVPGVGSGVFTPGGGSGDGGGSGSNSTNVVQPIVSLSQQLHSEETVPLLRVHTSRPEYLRLTALELFDGQRFTLGRLTGQRKDRVEQGLPTPPGTTRTTSVTAQVDVTSNLDEHYLPVPFAPTKVHGASGDWRLSRQTSTIFSVRTDTSGANYQVTSSVPAPTPTELNNQPRAVPADVALDTLLPPTLDPRVRRLARQLAGNASTPYQQVMALLRYLRSDSFTYDINGAPTTTDGALSAFLFTTRRGYCEQFASAMTVMVRALGLPARVAIGFTQGTRQRDGSYLITNKDAHSWPEVYFPTSGWVRFEPTVRTDGGTTDEPSYATPQTTAPDPGAAATQPTPEPSAAAPSTTPQDRLNARDNEPGGTAAQRGGHGSGRSVLWTVAGLVLLVLLTAPAAARLLVRRRRLSRRAGHDATAATHVAWAELVDIATDLKLDLPPSDSPRSSATRLGETLPGGDPGRDALRRLGVAEESARYAPPGSPVPDGSHPGHDVRTAEKSLRASVSLGRRARASLAPPSVLGRVRRTAASGVLDALDSGDRLAGRASSEVSRLLRRGRDGERTTGAGPGGPGSGSGSTEAESEREREKVPS